MRKKHSLKDLLRNILSAFLVIGLLYYLLKNWNHFQGLIDTSWYGIIGLIFCIVALWATSSFENFLIFQKFGPKINYWENLILAMAMVIGNYLPMRFGSVLRVQYLRKVHNVQYVKAVGIVSIRFLILLAISSLIIFVGAAYTIEENSLPVWTPLIVIFFLSATALGLLLTPKLKTKASDSFFSRTLANYTDTIATLKSHPGLFGQLAGLALVKLLFLAARLNIVFSSIGVDFPSWTLLMLASANSLIAFLSITPGNLGVREWIMGALVMVFGTDFSSGIFAATLDRGALLLCTFVLCPIPLAYVWSRVTR